MMTINLEIQIIQKETELKVSLNYSRQKFQSLSIFASIKIQFVMSQPNKLEDLKKKIQRKKKAKQLELQGIQKMEKKEEAKAQNIAQMQSAKVININILKDEQIFLSKDEVTEKEQVRQRAKPQQIIHKHVQQQNIAMSQNLKENTYKAAAIADQRLPQDEQQIEERGDEQRQDENVEKMIQQEHRNQIPEAAAQTSKPKLLQPPQQEIIAPQPTISIDEPQIQRNSEVKAIKIMLKDIDAVKAIYQNLQLSIKGLEYIQKRIKFDRQYRRKIGENLHLLRDLGL